MSVEIILDAATDAAVSELEWASLHPSSTETGSNENSAARQPVAWTASDEGEATLVGELEFAGAPSAAVQYIGFWTAETEGDFITAFPLSGDNAYNSEGEYIVTNLTATTSLAD